MMDIIHTLLTSLCKHILMGNCSSQGIPNRNERGLVLSKYFECFKLLNAVIGISDKTVKNTFVCTLVAYEYELKVKLASVYDIYPFCISYLT